MATETNNQTVKKPDSGVKSLAAIIAGIILGVFVGLVFGKAMWTASGGAQAKLAKLQKTAEQKKQFAEYAVEDAARAEQDGKTEEARRCRSREETLRGQIPVIEEEIRRTKELIAEHQGKLELDRDGNRKDPGYARKVLAAGFVWEVTKFFGDLFLQVLRLLVIPLVVTSMICGITGLGDVRRLGRLGGYTLCYYIGTCAFAVLLGIILVEVIQPGKSADDTFAYITESIEAKKDSSVMGTLLDVFRGREGDPGSGMFPSNIFLAMTKTNVLALIVFALVFGAALTTIGEKGRAAIDFFTGANEAVMKMVHMVMIFASVGIFGLVAANIAKNGGAAQFGTELARLGWYVSTVLLGLALHALVLGSLISLLAKRNPLTYTYNIMRALLTAMSTASSSATLPVTMECVEENNNVSNRSASFVLPLGATINMDGTALYEAVAVIFIAQSLGIPLPLGALVVIFFTATLAAVGAAGIPEAGLVTMVIVLTAVGLPMTGIGTILAIDWFLDRMRTTVNVYGDAVGAAVIDQIVPADGKSA